MKMLSLDFGSSQLKAMVMDENLSIEAAVSAKYPTYVSEEGHIEQCVKDWESALEEVLRQIALTQDLVRIDAISLSGHMSGLVCVDEEGTALHNCIMLSDSRSREECSIIASIAGEQIRQMTGNPIIDAFLLPKLLWIKRNQKSTYGRIYKFLFPKDYIRGILTDEFATEYTDAANALCMDPKNYQWNYQIIRLLDLKTEIFPDIHCPWECVGQITHGAAARFGFSKKTRVYYGAADMASGAVGNALFSEGDSTVMFGTSATFLSMVSGFPEKLFGKLTFHPHVVTQAYYALGSHFNGGLAVNWFSKSHSPDSTIDYDYIQKLGRDAEHVPLGSRGLITLPFLAGSGSPYFDSRDRQIIFGISTGTEARELFRSQLEGIACNLRQTIELFDHKKEQNSKRLLLTGGGCKIPVLPQIFADIFNVNVVTAENENASAVGSAIIGLFGEGVISDMKEAAAKMMNYKKEFTPDKNNVKDGEILYKKYLHCYQAWNYLKEDYVR